MQSFSSRRAFAAVSASVVLAACAPSIDNPYAKIQNPPLVQATLHTATVVSPDPAFTGQLGGAGYVPATLVSNYPASVRVEAMMWKVPEESVAAAALFMSGGQGLNLRVLTVPDMPPPAAVDAGVEKAFFRNVLGAEVPRLPAGVKLSGGARVQVWTYFVDDILVASRQLRAGGIPVAFNPVAITTAYLGDHKTLAIHAPDNTVIQLVQNQAQ